MSATSQFTSLRFLFALVDGGGSVPPQMAIARELRARGHQIRVLLGPDFEGGESPALQARIAATGCEVVPFRQHHRTPAAVPPPRGLLWGRTGRYFGPLWYTHRVYAACQAWADNVAEELRQRPADLLVTDYLLPGALLGAEIAGVPAAALIHTVYVFRPAPGIPPPGPGLQPARGPAGHLRDRVLSRAIHRVFERDGLPALNAARASFGLPPLHSPFEQYDQATRVLVLTSPSFDFPARSLPANVRYVGMAFERGDPMPAEPVVPEDDRPLVLVSLSTTDQQQGEVLHRLLDALATLPVRALVTLGPALAAASFSAPANVTLRQYVPHHAILPKTSVVVTHCGHGTVMSALYHGVPIVCVPMGRDQNDVAARVIATGAGVRLSPKASVQAIRVAITGVLAETRYRAQARRMAELLAREDGAVHGADELEAVARGASSGRTSNLPEEGGSAPQKFPRHP